MARTARGRRARMIVSMLHILELNQPALLIRLARSEVVEHRQDPAISPREVLDAVSLVWRDQR